MKKLLPLMLAGAFSMGALLAAPITYKLVGVADIYVDSVLTYEARGFTISIVSDTTGIAPGPEEGYHYNTGSATYGIEAGPSGAVNELLRVFSMDSVLLVSFTGTSTWESIVYGLNSISPAADLGFSYPKTDFQLADTADNDFLTAIGSLQFDNISSLSYEAIGGGGEVPEPSTYALIGGGLLALAFLRRRMG